MKIPRRRFLHLAASAAAVPTAPRVARAQGNPTRPVRVIVPYAPGGPTDIFGRLIAQSLSEHLGKQFYVENISGAGGNVGMGQGARAAPKEIVALLRREIVKAIALPGMKERMATLRFEPVGNTPEECAAQFRTETAKWGEVIREAGIKAQ